MAGVATGLMIPRGRSNDSVDGDPADTPLETLEHALHPWVAYAILPLFAFVNAGLSLSGIGFADALAPVPMGIALGLLLGKPIGVFGAGWIAVRMGWAQRPDEVGWGALFGMAVLCGIGFTMSLFIGSLAFDQGGTLYAESNRLGILLGSAVAALIGLELLHRALPPTRTAK